MLITRYGEYILRGRKQAALNAFVWSLVPLMGWLGVVIVCLITLRKGAFEGFIVLIFAILPSIGLAMMGHYHPLIYGVLCGSLVSWLLAVVLRETRSWALVLQVGTLIAMLAVIVIHGFVPDITLQWYQALKKYYMDAENALRLQVTAEQMQQLINIMAKIATGSQAVVLSLIALFNLLIARWWQAILFNPGGLTPELCQIRLGVTAVSVLALTIVAGLLGLSIGWDLLPLILALFFLAGLSLFHALVKMSKTKGIWIIGFYGLLIFFFPYMGILVVFAAVLDVFLNFRERIKRQTA